MNEEMNEYATDKQTMISSIEEKEPEIKKTNNADQNEKQTKSYNTKSPEWEAQKAQLKENIETAFDGLVPGMQISVNRTRPHWCAGWLDTIPVEFDVDGRPNIDLQTIKETFGGENLQLKFIDKDGTYLYAKTVHFKGIDPKENGEILESPALKNRRALLKLEAEHKEKKDTALSERLFEMMLKRTDDAQKDIITLVTAQNQKTTNPFAEMTAMMAMMDKFDRFRTPAPEPKTDEVANMMQTFMQMLGNQQQQQKPQQPKNKIMPPYRAMPPQIQMRPTAMPETDISKNKTPVPEVVQAVPTPTLPDDDGEEEMSLVDEIVSMDDREIADVVTTLMDELGEERGQRVFSFFATGPTESIDDKSDDNTEQTIDIPCQSPIK